MDQQSAPKASHTTPKTITTRSTYRINCDICTYFRNHKLVPISSDTDNAPHSSSSQPPSSSADRTRAGTLWTQIATTLTQNLSSNTKPDLTTYMSIYRSIHNFITNPQSQYSHHDKDERSEYLYLRLNDLITSHVAAIADAVLECDSGPEVLEAYVNEWTKFKEAAKVNGHLFRFIDRHWVSRVQDEKPSAGWLGVEELHFRRWGEGFGFGLEGDGGVVVKALEDTGVSEEVREAVVASMEVLGVASPRGRDGNVG